MYNTCGCGSCAEEVEIFFSCILSEDTGCEEFQCSDTVDGGANDTICDDEFSALGNCLPSQECADCFNMRFEQIANETSRGGITCATLENEICDIAPTCNCGCEPEAETFYGCLVDDATQAQCKTDCSDTKCDAELSASDDCLASSNPSCPQCVFEAIQYLFSQNEQISCNAFVSKTCTSIYTNCGCDSCGEEFEAYLFCEFADSGCEELECDSSQLAAPSVTQVTQTTPTSPPVDLPPPPRETMPPPTDSRVTPTLSPVSIDGEATNSRSSSDNGSFSFGYLAVLVAIPLIAVILYLMKRQKTQTDPKISNASRNAAALLEESNGTPPISPAHTPSSQTQNCITPSSPHHRTEPSITSSISSEEDYSISEA